MSPRGNPQHPLFKASIAFVVYMTRRTSGSKAMNGSRAPTRLAMPGRSRAVARLERLERLQRVVGVDRGIDRLEVPDDLVVLAARDVLQGVADEVHDARLDRRERSGVSDGGRRFPLSVWFCVRPA